MAALRDALQLARRGAPAPAGHSPAVPRAAAAAAAPSAGGASSGGGRGAGSPAGRRAGALSPKQAASARRLSERPPWVGPLEPFRLEESAEEGGASGLLALGLSRVSPAGAARRPARPRAPSSLPCSDDYAAEPGPCEMLWFYV